MPASCGWRAQGVGLGPHARASRAPFPSERPAAPSPRPGSAAEGPRRVCTLQKVACQPRKEVDATTKTQKAKERQRKQTKNKQQDAASQPNPVGSAGSAGCSGPDPRRQSVSGGAPRARQTGTRLRREPGTAPPDFAVRDASRQAHSYLREQRLESQYVDFLLHTLLQPVGDGVLGEEARELASQVPRGREAQLAHRAPETRHGTSPLPAE